MDVGTTAVGAAAVGATAVGAMAVGATAVGAAAVGAMAVSATAVGTRPSYNPLVQLHLIKSREIPVHNLYIPESVPWAYIDF